jgi:hypothetical protein
MSVFRHWQLGLLPTILIMSLISFSPQATARGGTVSHPDLASTRHIKELPPEIVKAVEHWRSLCGSPLAATSSFARYLDNEFSRYRFIVLHFHALSCGTPSPFCSREGCLHQVYALTARGTYHLVFSANVPDVTLNNPITCRKQKLTAASSTPSVLVYSAERTPIRRSVNKHVLMAANRSRIHTWVEWSCSQLLQNTPLHPIAETGRQRFGGTDAPAEQRLTDLESSLAQVKLDPAENAPLLAPLLDIPLPQERASTLAPEELRRRQLAALTNWVIASARTQPLVLGSISAARHRRARVRPTAASSSLTAAIVVTICLLGLMSDLLVDWLWFSAIGYLYVFWTTIGAQAGVFFTVFVATAIILWVNGSLASRFALPPWTQRPADFEWIPTGVATLPDLLEFMRQRLPWPLVIAGGAGLLSLLVAWGEVDNWGVFLRFLYHVPYGANDPLFEQDIGFYLFSLPAYVVIKNWMLLTLFLSALFAGVVYWVRATSSTTPRAD